MHKFTFDVRLNITIPVIAATREEAEKGIDKILNRGVTATYQHADGDGETETACDTEDGAELLEIDDGDTDEDDLDNEEDEG